MLRFSAWLLSLFFCCFVYAGESWKGVPYDGDVSVTVYANDDDIDVDVLTEDLLLRPVNWDEFVNYTALFSDAEIARQERREPWSPEQTFEQLRQWIWRWEEGADPFSAFTLYGWEDGKWTFAGYIALDHSTVKAEAELKFAVLDAFRNRSYAKQALQAIVVEYAPFLSELGYYVNLNDPLVLAAPFRAICAQVRADNPYAQMALKRTGFEHVGEEIISGVYIKRYRVLIEDLIPES